MADSKSISVPLNCEAHIMTLNENLLIGVHHFFSESSETMITFNKNKLDPTFLELSFSHELFGLNIRSVLYSNSADQISSFETPSDMAQYIGSSNILSDEPFSNEFKNSSRVIERDSKVCIRLENSLFAFNQTIAKNLRKD